MGPPRDSSLFPCSSGRGHHCHHLHVFLHRVRDCLCRHHGCLCHARYWNLLYRSPRHYDPPWHTDSQYSQPAAPSRILCNLTSCVSDDPAWSASPLIRLSPPLLYTKYLHEQTGCRHLVHRPLRSLIVWKATLIAFIGAILGALYPPSRPPAKIPSTPSPTNKAGLPCIAQRPSLPQTVKGDHFDRQGVSLGGSGLGPVACDLDTALLGRSPG